MKIPLQNNANLRMTIVVDFTNNIPIHSKGQLGTGKQQRKVENGRFYRPCKLVQADESVLFENAHTRRAVADLEVQLEVEWLRSS